MRITLIAVHKNNNADYIAFRLLDEDSNEVKDFAYNNVKQVLQSGKASISGIKLVGNKIKGSNGSLDRYPTIVNGVITENARRVTILATIDSIGYKVCDASGKIVEASTQALLNKRKDGLDVANGKIVEKNGAAYFSAIYGTYPNIPVEKTKTGKRMAEAKKNNSITKETKQDDTTTVDITYNKNRGDSLPRVITGVPRKDSMLKEVDEKTGMTVEQKLAATMLAIQEIRPFYYSILAILKRVEACKQDDVNTMAVSLDTLYFSSEFVKELPLSDLLFVMLHEVCHIAMKHRIRENGRNHKAWNYATDYFINKQLADEFGLTEVGVEKKANIRAFSEEYSRFYISIPDMALYNDKVDINNDTPETIYNEIEQNKNNNTEKNNANNTENNGGNTGDSGDNSSESGDNSSESGDNGDNTENNTNDTGNNGDNSTETGNNNSQSNSSNGVNTEELGNSAQQVASGIAESLENNNSTQTQNGAEQIKQGAKSVNDGIKENNTDKVQNGIKQMRKGLAEMKEGSNNSNESKQGLDDIEQGINGIEKSTEPMKTGKTETSGKGSKEKNFNNTDDAANNGNKNNNKDPRKQGSCIGKEFRGQKIQEVETDMVDDGNTLGKSPEQMNQQVTTLMSQAVSIYKQHHQFGGDNADFLERYVEKELAPKVNWRSIIRRFLTKASQKEYTFAHPDKRFLNRVNRDGSRQVFAGPHMADGGELENIKICIDTSGSITPKDLGVALAQISDLFKQYRAEAELLYWDTRIRAVYPFKDYKELLNKQPKGGGGTDVNCVFAHFENSKEYKLHKKTKPSLIIIFTDGYFGEVNKGFKKKYKNTIWIVQGNDKFEAPFGVKAALKNIID